MLQDRGYAVSQQFRNETRTEFETMWKTAVLEGGGRERFVILVGHRDDEESKLLVYFPDENKRVGVKPIRVLKFSHCLQC